MFSYSVVNREYSNLKLVNYVPTMEVRVKWKTCILLSETYNLFLWLLSFLGKFFHFDRPHHISLTHWLDILHSLFFVGHLLLVLNVVSIYLIHWKLWLKPIITSSLLVCWQGDGRPFWKLVVSEATGSTNNDYFEEVYKVTFHDSGLKLS